MARAKHMLSTVDNPWNPFTHYDEWFSWDMHAGYNTPALLARVAVTSEELSENLQSDAIEEAIDDILEAHNGGLYLKVAEPS